MLRIRQAGWLLAVALGLPSWAGAQTVEHREADTLQAPARPAPSGGRQPELARVPGLIVGQTNAFRRLKGDHEVEVNADLTKAAQAFAEYLARTDKFSHTADGHQPSQRVSAAGYDYCIVAENIAWEYNSAGFTTRGLAQALVTGWKNSPEHRRNMLDPDVTQLGVGVARSDKTGRYYAVQDFGRPRSLAIRFSVANESDGVARYTVEGKAFTLPPNAIRTHERCRPADVDFEGVDDTPAPEDANVFHPTNGKHYVIRGDKSSGYRMTERP